MNGPRPGIRRFAPAGSRGADCLATGILGDFCAMVTLSRSASRRPATPLTAAAPATPALMARKLLRGGSPPSGTGRLPPGGPERPPPDEPERPPGALDPPARAPVPAASAGGEPPVGLGAAARP